MANPTASAIAIVSFVLSACTTTAGTGDQAGADAGRVDAGDVIPADAAAQATPTPIELTQNLSSEIKDGFSRVCKPDDTDAHYETSYYRVFHLPDHGVVGSLEVERVGLAIQSAISASGSQEMRVRLHLLEGEPALANLTLVRQEVVVIADQAMTAIDVPIQASIPADAKLVVELFLPDGVEAQNYLRVGMNDAGETAPAYVRAVAAVCTAPDMTPAGDVGIGDHHLILRVGGKHFPDPE
jgi:hypothetical protein